MVVSVPGQSASQAAKSKYKGIFDLKMVYSISIQKVTSSLKNDSEFVIYNVTMRLELCTTASSLENGRAHKS